MVVYLMGNHFNAIITDKAGNATTGTQSGTSIAFDQSDALL